MGLEDIIGYKFKNKALLDKALTHRSYTKNPFYSNELLEFLGDAVLELIISEYLVTNYQNLREGELSKIRASTVNSDVLSDIGKSLKLYDYCKLGKSERQKQIAQNKKILEDSLEALIGAIYLDSGLQSAKNFILPLLEAKIEKFSEYKLFDPKTVLQELTQKKFTMLPEYVLIKEEGEQHNKTFYSKVIIGNKSYGIGIGKSKKEAEKNAALETMEILENV
ncbi:Ribonuclease 3 [Desulfurella amilsii]|uniref:Ribonuclease 3 n=1 Tax=Desulfurella amilsii TaxID=1562698 RepID=A0A1X4XVW5_9BACT|nr:ribonuclease III [Desulfurella amilsii]OSS41683.1 Ribonuclease 3 [Desulfurella amilsii]